MDDEFSPAVAIGHACDALILATDALCHRFEQPTPRRHDEAPGAIARLVKLGHIPAEAAHWRDFLTTALKERARFQYHGAMSSRGDARRFVARAARFVDFVRSWVQAPTGD